MHQLNDSQDLGSNLPATAPIYYTLTVLDITKDIPKQML